MHVHAPVVVVVQTVLLLQEDFRDFELICIAVEQKIPY